MKKFEIGERVVILEGITGTEGNIHTVIEIVPDNSTFENDIWMYKIDDGGNHYYLNNHLKLDVKSHRERILKKLLEN